MNKINQKKAHARMKRLAWRKANREKIRAWSKAYYVKNRKPPAAKHCEACGKRFTPPAGKGHGKEIYCSAKCRHQEKLAYQKDYHENNREKDRIRKAAWYQANQKRISAHQKAYRAVNKKRVQAQRKAYRESLKG